MQAYYLIITGFGKNAGKTTIACAISHALKKSGCRVRTFKVGADPVDASRLSSASESVCLNLDPYLMSLQDIDHHLSLAEQDADFIIIETTLDRNSQLTHLFRNSYKFPELYVESYLSQTSYFVSLSFPTDWKKHEKVVKFIFDIDNAISKTRQITRHLSGFLANRNQQVSNSLVYPKPKKGHCIFVALDEALGGSSQNNLHFLLQRSSNVYPFSPLRDKKLHSKPSFIYFGSGQVSEFLPELSKNSDLIKYIRDLAIEGTVMYADGDAIAYLMDYTVDKFGSKHEMLGLFSGYCQYRDRARTYGYCKAWSIKNHFLCSANSSLYVYFDSDFEVKFLSNTNAFFKIMRYDNEFIGWDGYRHYNVFSNEFRTIWNSESKILENIETL